MPFPLYLAFTFRFSKRRVLNLRRNFLTYHRLSTSLSTVLILLKILYVYVVVIFFILVDFYFSIVFGYDNVW